MYLQFNHAYPLSEDILSCASVLYSALNVNGCLPLQLGASCMGYIYTTRTAKQTTRWPRRAIPYHNFFKVDFSILYFSKLVFFSILHFCKHAVCQQCTLTSLYFQQADQLLHSIIIMTSSINNIIIRDKHNNNNNNMLALLWA